MKWLLFSVAVLVLVLDYWTKSLVISSMELHQTIKLPLDIIQLTYINNTGGAFGMLPNQTVFFLLAGCLAVVAIVVVFPTLRQLGTVAVVCGGAVLGGAIGNMIDRVRYGYVVDFLDLGWWPVFNVADIGITVGITVLVVMSLLASYKTEDLSSAASADDSGAPASDESTAAKLG